MNDLFIYAISLYLFGVGTGIIISVILTKLGGYNGNSKNY